jgi:hypothetical protein
MLSCRCVDKMLWPMQLVDFGGLNLFFLVILSELTIECVIWFL